MYYNLCVHCLSAIVYVYIYIYTDTQTILIQVTLLHTKMVLFNYT